MKQQRRKRTGWSGPVVLSCCLSVMLVGCADNQILDETGFSTIAGYDKIKNGMLRGTVLLPVINPEAQEKIQVVSGVSRTSKGIRDQINLQMDKRVLSGQLRVALYQDKLAREGIINIVDTLYRDPSIATRLYLGVYEGETYQMLTYPFKEEGNIGMYLYRLLEQNVREEKIPSPTIHEFVRAYFSMGSDPYLPYIRQKGDELYVDGLALFSRDRFVGRISNKEAFILKLVRDQFEVGSYEATVPQEYLGSPAQKKRGKAEKNVDVVFDTLQSKADIKLVRHDPPKFQIGIKLSGRVLEISEEVDLSDMKVLAGIEKGVAEELKLHLERLMQKLQKMRVDPIGFGDIYRSQRRGIRKMTYEDWMKLYQKAEFQFQTKARVIRSGVID